MSKIKFNIEWDMDTGRIELNGPIHLKGLCKDLIKKVEKAIDEYEPPVIVPISIVEKKEIKI